MKKHILKIYYRLSEIKNKSIIFYNKQVTSKRKPPIVKDIDETLNKIINERYSVSRFGDGEFGLMRGKNIIFQAYSHEFMIRLKEVIKSNYDNHIVCIPDVFGGLDRFNEKPQKYWTNYLNLNRSRIYKIIDRNKEYYDALVTRLYIDLKDKEEVKERFEKIKLLWKDREIIIVEGEKSRLGIGNDLFKNAKSIERIICPSINAFEKYDDILKEVKKQNKSKLILIALGPTATVLSYDLAKEGYQAVDIGHIDIEYEWFLQGAIEKCPVENKYIAEIDGGTNIQKVNNENYKREILVNII